MTARTPNAAPVYDILDCGPRNRFAANGKLVHNSQKINMQNLPQIKPITKRTPNGALIMTPGGWSRLFKRAPDMGKIMGAAKAQLAGKADMGQVSAAVKAVLAG